MSEQAGVGSDDYQAFISYSHAADGKLAIAVQKALRRFGKRWYSRSSVRIFRDQTGLGLTPDLWGEIQNRLERSKCFILLASPEAARSEWVQKEVLFWRQHRSADRLLIVLTGGELVWSPKDGEFDWTQTTALPPSLQGAFDHEPLWADLRWEGSDANLSLREQRFFVEIAKLVAGLRQVPLEKVFDEATEDQRKATRLLRITVGALAALAIAALSMAVVSIQAKRTADRLANEATRQKRQVDEAGRAEEERLRLEATSKALAARAAAVRPQDRELSTLLSLEALGLSPTREAEDALRQTVLESMPPMVLRGHSDVVYDAEFSSDGKRVVTASGDGSIRLWDASTGANVRTLEIGGDARSMSLPRETLSADGTKVLTMLRPETMAVGYWENPGAIELLDAATGKKLVSISDRFAVRASLSPDNTQIVTGGFDTSAKLWDARTGKLQFELRGHEQRVSAARFSSNGKWAITASWDGTARVWDAKTGKSLAVLHAEKLLESASFTPDGTKILTLGADTAGEDKYLQLWDWMKTPGGSSATFNGHDGSITDYAISPDGLLLATASTDQTARIWDTTTGRCLHVLSGHEDFVNGVAFSPIGRWVATASGDGRAQVWDSSTGDSLIGLGNGHSRTGVAFSPDGKRVVTGTTSGVVLVYSCPALGSIEDLRALARSRVRRELTEAEREKYLAEPGGQVSSSAR